MDFVQTHADRIVADDSPRMLPIPAPNHEVPGRGEGELPNHVSYFRGKLSKASEGMIRTCRIAGIPQAGHLGVDFRAMLITRWT